MEQQWKEDVAFLRTLDSEAHKVDFSSISLTAYDASIKAIYNSHTLLVW